MPKLLCGLSVLACMSLASVAVAAATGPATMEHNVAVRLPPSPCIQAHGQMLKQPSGRAACVVPVAKVLPPGPCAQKGGRMTSTIDGRRVCVFAGGGGKAAMDDWETR